MIVVFLGEGASDVGTLDQACFRPGAMAELVDKLVEKRLDFAPVANGRGFRVSRSELALIAKSSGAGSRMFLPSNTIPAGYASHVKYAAALAIHTMKLELCEDDVAVAIYFQDSDGTCSTPEGNWECIWRAISMGFSRVKFDRGVPMIPRPKQEAWLLCAIRSPSYHNCSELEGLSGNDSSPRSIKSLLEQACGSSVNTELMCEWIRDGRVDPDKIAMPSFRHFREALDRAIENAKRR